MPIPSEYREIVSDLWRATEQGRINWVTARYGVTVTVLDAVIELWGGEDSETEKSFVSCSLKDPEKVGAHGNALDHWFVEEGDSDFPFMNKLFQTAKRQGLGIPQKLSVLSRALKGQGVIGDTRSPSDEGDEIPF